MVPMEPWRNSTPDFGAAAFCTTKIDDFRSSLTSPFRSSRRPRSKVSDLARRRQASYDIARLLPQFLVRQPSVRQKLTILGLFDVNLFDDMVDPFIKEEVIEVDQLQESNSGGH